MDLKAKYGPLTIGKDPKQEKKKRGGIGGIIEGIAKSAVKPFTGLAVEGTRAVGQGIPSNLMALGQLTGNSKLQSVGLKGSEAVDRAIGSLSENEEMKDWGLGGYFTGDERKKGELGTGVRKIGGNTAQQIGTVMPIARGAGVLKTIASGAKAGGLTGAGATATEDGTDLGDIITGGVMGGATGGGMAGGGRLFGKMTGKGRVPNSDTPKGNVGRHIDAEASGLGIGQPTPGGGFLTPDRSDELLQFAREGSKKYISTGVKSGKPRTQALQAQNLKNAVEEQLDTTLSNLNRKLDPKEVQRLATDVDFKITSDPNITGKTALTDKFKELVASKDLAGLEKLRRTYDKTGYTATGAGKTAKAAEARAIRDTIDEFITPLSDDYKAIKGDWANANELLRMSSKGSYGAKGGEIPLVNVKTGGQTMAGAKSKAGNFMNRVLGGGDDAPPVPVLAGDTAEGTIQGLTDNAGQLAKSFLGRMTRQGITANAGTSGLGDQETPELSTEDYIAEDPGFQYLAQAEEEAQAETGSADPYDPSNAEKNVQAILQQGGDQKDVAAYLANVETLSALKGGGANKGKPLNASQRKEANNAVSALKDIGNIRKELDRDGSAALKAGMPGGSLTQRLTGTSGFASSQKNVVDAIARLRSGAAITEDEAKRYMALLPGRFDNKQDANAKLDRLEELLYSFTYPEGGTGTNIEDLLTAQ